jgi:hypothetical protein
LGSNTPRKRNSSPKIVLNTAIITNKAKNFAGRRGEPHGYYLLERDFVFE